MRDQDLSPSFSRPNRPASDTKAVSTNPKSVPGIPVEAAAGAEARASKGNKEGLDLTEQPPKFHLLSVLAVLIPHMKYTQQETRKETLRWLIWLQEQLPKRVSLS